jgi:predicted PurR-regulated permease PerM
MATALGLFGLVGFIIGVILLASAITWLVVKITPQRDSAEQRS